MTLSGCTTTPPTVPNVPFQENLRVKCPETLPRLNGVTGKDISDALLWYFDNYPACAARHNQLVDEINQREELIP
nr:hypothetical protein [Serratia marcescens]